MKRGRRTLRCQVKLENHGLRLDQFLATVYSDQSRAYWRKVVAIGGVHLDGRRMSQCSREVHVGQQLEIFIDGLPLEKWQIGAAHVLYQDPFLLVLNKPAGIDTQPTPSRYQGTVYQGVLDFLGRERRHGRKPEVGMVQRLDRDTSGVIAFSIHPRSHRGLTQQFNDRRVQKTYLAMVSGSPEAESGEFSSSLAKIRATNLVRSVKKGGKQALTRYRVLSRGEEGALVQVEPVTGRSHQIRAHFAEAGYPLIGDLRYGAPATFAGVDVDTHMLHAWQLQLAHPVSGEPLWLTAPWPVTWNDFSAAAGLKLPIEGKIAFDQEQDYHDCPQ